MSLKNNILHRPFPVIETTEDKLFIAFGGGLIVFLFLAIFQPFGLDKIENNKFLYFAGYGLITTLAILINVFIVMNLFKNFFLIENWTVGKSFFHSSIITIFIAFFNWLYFIAFDKPSNLDYSFLYFIFMTIAVGIFPSLFSIFFLENRLRNRNIMLAEKVNRQLKSSSQNRPQIEELSFDSANSHRVLQTNIVIKSENLLCVKSMGNYVTLFFLEENQLKKKIIRSTMKGIEKNISKSHKIIRCHKSYFVNINRVITTSGNARALYLHIENLDFQIPVSRSFSKKMILGTL